MKSGQKNIQDTLEKNEKIVKSFVLPFTYFENYGYVHEHGPKF